MIVVDTNVLIAAIHTGSAQHERAAAWLKRATTGHERIAMPWVCLLGFVRITTHPRVFEHPLRVEQATEALDALLAHPSVEPVNPTAAHPAILSRLLHEAGTAGNLTTDARIAAIAIERDARVATFDRNLARFGVRVVVPE